MGKFNLADRLFGHTFGHIVNSAAPAIAEAAIPGAANIINTLSALGGHPAGSTVTVSTDAGSNTVNSEGMITLLLPAGWQAGFDSAVESSLEEMGVNKEQAVAFQQLVENKMIAAGLTKAGYVVAP